MTRHNHEGNVRGIHNAITISLLLGLCSLILSSMAFTADRIHLDNVPYVVQRERLD